MRHNEIRDLTAAFLHEVATCVKVEPNLKPITDSEEVFDTRRSLKLKENSRLDVKLVQKILECRARHII